jgi:hypothetical protein
MDMQLVTRLITSCNSCVAEFWRDGCWRDLPIMLVIHSNFTVSFGIMTMFIMLAFQLVLCACRLRRSIDRLPGEVWHNWLFSCLALVCTVYNSTLKFKSYFKLLIQWLSAHQSPNWPHTIDFSLAEHFQIASTAPSAKCDQCWEHGDNNSLVD